MDLKIDSLRLNLENVAGQEHRVRPIVLRGLALLAERLDERAAAGTSDARLSDRGVLRVPPVRLDLRGMSDEQAAGRLADDLVAALARHLEL